MFARTFTGRATRMAIPRWENVETGPLGERMILLLDIDGMLAADEGVAIDG